jgi:hypothetical protein
VGKRLAVAALAVIVAGIVLVALSGRLFRDPAPEASVAATDAAVADAADERWRTVAVLEVSGSASRRGPGGEWAPLQAGDLLAVDDVIRTGDDGTVSLDVGGVASVTVDPGSQISVPALTRTLGRIALEQGRVAARVAGRGAFGVTVPDSDTLARTERGAFAVIASGEGEATIAATEGEVEVSAADTEVTVAAGEQTQVRAGGPPAAPQAIPASLFLKVERQGRVGRSRQVELRGTTAPGAVIRVNGVRVVVSETGAFTAAVPLEEGDNRVAVESLDVAGRRESTDVDVTVDSRGPKVGGDVTWGP